MSLTYLIGGGNIFNYQNIPENYIIYRSGSNGGFQTITNNIGVLMNYNNEYKFGIPTAYELVENYSDNSIVMTNDNKLVTVPVEGTSENKLLRYIDNQWKIVDFSIEYIKPELYNSNSWQLWIADSDINVINIPKDELYIYGISYSDNQFILTNLYEHNINEIVVKYNNTEAFKNVYEKAKIYADTNSNNTDLYTCIFSHDVNEIFNGDLIDDISISSSLPSPDFTINTIFVYYGLLIKNVNNYTSNSKIISICKNNTTSITYEDNGVFRNISNCVSFDNTIIIPAETISSNLSNFIYSTDLKIYFMIQTDSNDTAEYYWYYPRNYINMYLKRV